MSIKVDMITLRGASDQTTQTSVLLYTGHGREEWIKGGYFSLHENKSSWRLDFKLPKATDCDHDSAVELRMELVGVKLSMVSQRTTFIDAWISGDSDLFRVPVLGWNQLEGSVKCKDKACTRDGSHVIVADGRYIPPRNAELYELVRGMRIEIISVRP